MELQASDSEFSMLYCITYVKHDEEVYRDNDGLRK